GGVESVGASSERRVDHQFCLFAGGDAAIRIDPPCLNLVFEYHATPLRDPVEPSMAPIPCSFEERAIRSMVSSGRLMNAAMRLRKSRSASSNAPSVLNAGPSTAAGSSIPQCTVTGCPGQTGQVSPAALSQTVKTKSILGAPCAANSSHALERRPS